MVFINTDYSLESTKSKHIQQMSATELSTKDALIYYLHSLLSYKVSTSSIYSQEEIIISDFHRANHLIYENYYHNISISTG